MVSGVGAVSVSEEGCGLYPAQESGSHVRLPACVRGNGRGSRTGSGIQHSFRGLHIFQNSPQVSTKNVTASNSRTAHPLKHYSSKKISACWVMCKILKARRLENGLILFLKLISKFPFLYNVKYQCVVYCSHS